MTGGKVHAPITISGNQHAAARSYPCGESWWVGQSASTTDLKELAEQVTCEGCRAWLTQQALEGK